MSPPGAGERPKKKGRRGKKKKKGATEPSRRGVMTSMVGGFRKAVGADSSKKPGRGWVDLAVTIALAVAVAFFVVQRCGA